MEINIDPKELEQIIATDKVLASLDAKIVTWHKNMEARKERYLEKVAALRKEYRELVNEARRLMSKAKRKRNEIDRAKTLSKFIYGGLRRLERHKKKRRVFLKRQVVNRHKALFIKEALRHLPLHKNLR